MSCCIAIVFIELPGQPGFFYIQESRSISAAVNKKVAWKLVINRQILYHATFRRIFMDYSVEKEKVDKFLVKICQLILLLVYTLDIT